MLEQEVFELGDVCNLPKESEKKHYLHLLAPRQSKPLVYRVNTVNSSRKTFLFLDVYQESRFLPTTLRTEPEKIRTLVFIGCDRRPMVVCPLCVFHICFWLFITPENAKKQKKQTINSAFFPS